jgi:hypothetical protein
VLSEEHGEVSRIVADSLSKRVPIDTAHLREELVQLAACCVAWVEGIDAYSDEEIAEREHETEEARLARIDRQYDEQGGWHSSPEAAIHPTHNID